MLNRAMIFVVTETPLHAGGGTSLGGVDLPIQRERHTQYPMIQSSTIKGVLRDLAYRVEGIDSATRRDFQSKRKADTEEALTSEADADNMTSKILSLEAAFGPETDRADTHASALSFADARILLFPVRSLQGVFAWVTSPFVLQRFARELERVGCAVPWRVPSVRDEEALVSSKSTVTAGESVVLEEYDFTVSKDDTNREAVDQIAQYLSETLDVFGRTSGASAYWSNRLWNETASEAGRSNLIILPDTAFRDFVIFSTEVVSRIRIDRETGTAAQGALWSEEHLPSDSVLYVPVLASPPRGPKTKGASDESSIMKLLSRILESEEASAMQLGGDETVGRGFARLRLLVTTTQEG
jgi:CRISPR-associated protein Cmr4